MNKIDIQEELGKNFLVYAIDTDQNKAFPAVADGLLPGARAALWEMYKQKYFSNKPHVKSAKVASGVIGRWWPHNQDATYGTLVRMAQPFVENTCEIDFQGAVGNTIIGQQSYGSARYTEMRLSPLVEKYMLAGIEKDNSEMIWNYLQDEKWPRVFPSIFPRLLVNGSMGLGVGMSQNFVPHNLTDTCNLIINYLKTGELDNKSYFPDFPTGATIVNKDDLSLINKNGHGKVVMESKYIKSEKNHALKFIEFPYQVYIEPTIDKIKQAVNAGKIVSVDDILNTSDKSHISISVKVKPEFTLDYCVNELFSNSPLRTQINVNQNAIINQIPERVNLKTILDVYLKNNFACLSKEYQYDLKMAKTRLEIINGLLIVLENTDKVVKIIKDSEQPKAELAKAFNLSEEQIKAIMDMRLTKLSKMENKKLLAEKEEKIKIIKNCEEVLSSDEKQKSILISRIEEMNKEFGGERKTEVIQKEFTRTVSSASEPKEKVIEDIVFTFNPLGYVQNIPLKIFRKGKFDAVKTTSDDIVLLFSNQGRYFRVGTKDIKSCTNTDKGTALGSVLDLQNKEKIVSMYSNIPSENKPYILFVTTNGKVKKTIFEQYAGKTRNVKGLAATNIQDGDSLLMVAPTNGNDIILFTKNKKYIRFAADEINPSGRNTTGVTGIKLAEDDEVVKVEIVGPKDKSEYIKTKRAGKGRKYE